MTPALIAWASHGEGARTFSVNAAPGAADQHRWRVTLHLRLPAMPPVTKRAERFPLAEGTGDSVEEAARRALDAWRSTFCAGIDSETRH